MPSPLDETEVAALVARLFPNLERVWAVELGPHAEDEPDQLASATLSAIWDDLIKGVFGVLDTALASFKADGLPGMNDPLRSRSGLLGPLSLERHEPTHTQALRFLFDPTESHSLNWIPLHALLNAVKKRHSNVDQLVVTAKKSTTIKVEAERVAYLPAENGIKARNPRTDLWIELGGPSGGTLVVIENKVDDAVREGQLEAYEDVIALRLARLGVGWTALRILLSLDGKCKDAWLGLGFLELAGAFTASLPGGESEGEYFLRMYITSLLREVYGIEWQEHPNRSEQALLVRYLEAQQGVV